LATVPLTLFTLRTGTTIGDPGREDDTQAAPLFAARFCCKKYWRCGTLWLIRASRGVSSMSQQHPFKWRHFEPAIILLCMRWYVRYSLSYRDLEELMLERGLRVDHTTIYRSRAVLCSRTGPTLPTPSENHDRFLARR
jgi:hypothetical protein